MKERVPQEKRISRTLESNPKASNQISFNNNRQNQLRDCKAIQRMVALAIGNRDDENDTVIMTNLKYALDYAGGPVVDLGANADFSRIKKDEDLMLLEHGSEGSINGFGGGAIVEKLTDSNKGIPQNVDIAGIIVLSCNAGLPKERGGTSLVQDIARGLKSKGRNIVVDGKMGLALTSPSTGERTVLPDKKGKYMGLQNDMVNNSSFASSTCQF